MKYTFYILLAILVMSVLIFALKKKIKPTPEISKIPKKMGNKIELLHPKIVPYVNKFLNEARKQGIELRVTDGLRTFEEQDALYAKGRTVKFDSTGKKLGIVTHAKGGQSNHNFGLAIDVVPIENGKANYSSKNWAKIGEIGKSVGFKWGGDFTNLVDKPHFEMMFGKSLAQLQALYAQGKTTGGYVNLV